MPEDLMIMYLVMLDLIRQDLVEATWQRQQADKGNTATSKESFGIETNGWNGAHSPNILREHSFSGFCQAIRTLAYKRDEFRLRKRWFLPMRSIHYLSDRPASSLCFIANRDSHCVSCLHWDEVFCIRKTNTRSMRLQATFSSERFQYSH